MTLDRLALSRSTLDRAAERRGDPDWLAQRWAAPASRVLVVADGQVLVRSTEEGVALPLCAPAQAPEGERYLLGVDAGDTAYFAVAAAALPDRIDGARVDDMPVDGVRAAGLREVGALLDDRDAGLLVHAVALEHWHRAHPRCARCGALTQVQAAGHLRRCPVEGSEHYPRTDPAVIMTVVDGDDRLLLGRQPRWPERRYSTLAGFVEPGESLEQAVRREVLEEVGVVVGAVDYLGSQPWPFPSSLMLGFAASAESTALALDSEEIADARWFSRDALAVAVEARQVLLPPPVSIARRLIEHWYDGPLGDPDDW